MENETWIDVGKIAERLMQRLRDKRRLAFRTRKAVLWEKVAKERSKPAQPPRGTEGGAGHGDDPSLTTGRKGAEPAGTKLTVTRWR